jgi:hypothetical protein
VQPMRGAINSEVRACPMLASDKPLIWSILKSIV